MKQNNPKPGSRPQYLHTFGDASQAWDKLHTRRESGDLPVMHFDNDAAGRAMTDLIGPIEAGEILTVLGRTGHGKTTLSTWIAIEQAAQFLMADPAAPKLVAYVTHEMLVEQVHDMVATHLMRSKGWTRTALRAGGIPPQARAEFSAVHATFPFEYFGKSLPRIKDGLYHGDNSALTNRDIFATLRALGKDHNVGLIVVDYLQLAPPEHGEKAFSRRVEVRDIMQRIRDCATVLNCPAIVTAQANRRASGVVPVVYDALPRREESFESSDIEHESNTMLSVWRPTMDIATGSDIYLTNDRNDANPLVATRDRYFVRNIKSRLQASGTLRMFEFDMDTMKLEHAPHFDIDQT